MAHLGYERGKDPTPRAISVEGVHNGFYAYKAEDGGSDHSNETRMADDVEGPFGILMQVLPSDLYVANASHSRILASYVANLFYRTDQARKASINIAKETSELQARLMRDQTAIRQLTAARSVVMQGPVAVAGVLQSFGEAFARESGDVAVKRSFLRDLQKFERHLADSLYGRPYGLLRAPEGSEFIITDNPILTRLPMGDRFSIGEGFEKPGIHVIVPISPFACIQIGIAGGSRTIKENEVNAINDDLIRLMHKKAYSRRLLTGIETRVNNFGKTVVYKVNAFVTPKLTYESFVNYFVDDMLSNSKIPRDKVADEI